MGGIITSLATGVTLVRADELSDLRQQVESQRSQVENQYSELIKVQNKLLELEAAQEAQAVMVRKLESNRSPAISEKLSWLENIKLFGDFRYRYEYNSWDDDAGNSRHRDRNFIRLRIGMKTKINDEFGFNLRLITGSDNPTGANQTLGDETQKEFASRDIRLDHAYATYIPQWGEGLRVLAGKMPTPFYRPGSSQLIWDSDLSPEGVAIQYSRNVSEAQSIFANFGYMLVEENKNGDFGIDLFGIQGGLKHAFDNSTLTYGTSYIDYISTAGHAALANGFKGNSNTGSGGTYLYDYSMVEIFGDYTTKLGNLPIELYGDYVVNTASDVQEDTGWLVGTIFGKAKAKAVGSSQFGYEYRDLGRDCVVGTFSDSDFIGGGTGGKGHKFNCKYQIAKNTQLSATYCWAERIAGTDNEKDDDYNKLQLDFIVKF